MKFTNPPIAPLAGSGSPTLIPPPPREAASIWMASVVKPVAQNVIGGLGVAIFIAALGWKLAPTYATPIAKWALVIGAMVFGGACAVRAFADEITLFFAAYAEGQRDATTEALKTENARLLTEINRLKSEGMVAHAWGAREAAERLVQDYWQALASNLRDMRTFLGRAESMQRGMKRSEWEQGVRFLQNAGVLDRGVMLVATEEEALAAIARHAATSRVSVRAANGDMTKL